ncbi:MAG: hypothetical protein ACUVS2_01225 [Candidatus Flexifilum sp.]|jgi:hypothetical protein
MVDMEMILDAVRKMTPEELARLRAFLDEYAHYHVVPGPVRLGQYAGQIWLSDDFDAPIDFAEWMSERDDLHR